MRTSLGLPPHRSSSATLAGAYPFLSPRALDLGPFVGVDPLTGTSFGFDPWALYEAGHLTNPNVLLAGVIGQGKSALAKSLAVRSIAAGRRVYVPGDPKGEWAVVAEAVGGRVVRLGPGLPDRLNPLEAVAREGNGPQVRARRLRLLASISETTLGRPISPGERSALESAVAPEQPYATVNDVLAALINPRADSCAADGTTVAERVSDGRDIVHALRRLARGDLAGIFDGPSTQQLDASAPMTVLDLSRLGSDETALAIAMACASAWLEAALADTDASGQRWIIYDEAWRLMRSLPLMRRMQEQWKLSRAYGIANMLIVHRLSDLAAVGESDSEARALADGLLADCSTRIIYRQETDQLRAVSDALGLTSTECDLLPLLLRGSGLWKLSGCSYVVCHQLHCHELATFGTDQRMSGV